MDDFLQARHAMFAMPESTVYHLVRSATGQEPVRQERLVRGRDNSVVGLNLSGVGPCAVIRPNRDGSPRVS